jgi:hypothetical protein
LDVFGGMSEKFLQIFCDCDVPRPRGSTHFRGESAVEVKPKHLFIGVMLIGHGGI